MLDSLPKRVCRMVAGPASGGSSSHIPDDVIFFQILILLPVKCLVRFQSVCKIWRATIISTQFFRCHLEHSRTRSSMLIIPRRYHKDHSKFGIQGVNFYSFQPGQSKVAELILRKYCPGGIPMFSIPLHCDGLILIPCALGRVFLCNPATTEFIELPQGSRKNTCQRWFAFGFDPWSGKYKVARYFFHSSSEALLVQKGQVLEHSTGHEILTIGDGGDAWKWKATMDPPYAIDGRTPICLPGFFYWSALHSFTGHGINKDSSHVILRFSLRDETFTVHPNPPCRGFLKNNNTLCELGGKLCYVHSSSPSNVAIWLAEDGPDLAWLQRCHVTLPIPRTINVLACASTDKDKIFLSIDVSYLLKCDMRDGSVEVITDMSDILYDHRNGKKFCTVPACSKILECTGTKHTVAEYMNYYDSYRMAVQKQHYCHEMYNGFKTVLADCVRVMPVEYVEVAEKAANFIKEHSTHYVSLPTPSLDLPDVADLFAPPTENASRKRESNGSALRGSRSKFPRTQPRPQVVRSAAGNEGATLLLKI